MLSFEDILLMALCFLSGIRISTCGHVCSETYYEARSKRFKCGWWDTKRCTNYWHVTFYRSTCCSGWTSLPYCDRAICNGYTNPYGCNIKYDYDSIRYESGHVQSESGGDCYSPNRCRYCNDGFYADGSKCRICPKIPFCHHRRCSYPGDNTCNMCYYENILNKRYDRAYKYDPSQHACRKTCSWRSDSNLCFPGYCSTEFTESCTCTIGFGGSSCQTITKPVEIVQARSTFYDSELKKAESPRNINQPWSTEISWTNNIDLNELDLAFITIYRPQGTIPKYGLHSVSTDYYGFTSYSHYVVEFKYGIISGKVTAFHIRDGKWTSLFNSGYRNCMETFSVMTPCPVNQQCTCKTGKIDIGQTWAKFKHNDRVHISFDVQNGGYLYYENRDYKNSPSRKKNVLTGMKTNHTYLFHWDTESPFFDCSKIGCPAIPVTVPDITKTNRTGIDWNEWSDNLSGMDYYEFEVYDLLGKELVETNLITKVSNIGRSPKKSTSFYVSNPGMYSVLFRAFDKAGNNRTSRRLFLYDNSSEVETYNGTISVDNQTDYCNKTWITNSDPVLYLNWTDRFINTRHDQNYWLNKVVKRDDVDNDYDDVYGIRTTGRVNNVLGITKFEIAHFVYGPELTSSTKYNQIPNVYDQSGNQTLTWEDGQKAIFSIRAYDIFGGYLEDNKTVYKDTSPPVISNLWITRDHHGNGTENTTSITLNWDLYDYHSGISLVEWHLFENINDTRNTIANDNMDSQGNTKNLTDCDEIFSDSHKSPACYCTMFHGCYHQHFQVHRNITQTSEMGRGVDDLDYYVEVKGTNMASLTSVQTIKLIIDESPPVTGHVMEGKPGTPEVDYQQNLHIDAHWDGFIDHESGVLFYQYQFSTKCLFKNDFLDNEMVKSTQETTASFNVTEEGTYYVTVVAINKAREMSEPVCSDGITISTVVPSVKDVVVTSARTEPRLLMDDNGNAWLLDTNLRKHLVENCTTTFGCSNVSSDDILEFPEIYGSLDKKSLHSLTHLSGKLVRVLPKILTLDIKWNPTNNLTIVYDYEVGLSSTKNNPVPDFLEFRSSKHHTQFSLDCLSTPTGRMLYIIIKCISKSNVIGTQSFGPYIIDTTAPEYNGDPIRAYLNGSRLVANWSTGSFGDMDQPYPLRYEYAIGHKAYGSDVQPYLPISQMHPSAVTDQPTGTSVDISQLDWNLHDHHEYYISIKATNLAGLSVIQTSLPYRHDIQLPTPGIVIDIPVNSAQNANLEVTDDIDFTNNKNTLEVKWWNFQHHHFNIAFYACVGTFKGNCDVFEKARVDNGKNYYQFSSLRLHGLQKYYTTVFAETVTGMANASSDGITFIGPETNSSDIHIINGKRCSGSENIPLKLSHHKQDTRPTCNADPKYQISTSILNFHWNIPTKYLKVFTHAFWTLEELQYPEDVWLTLNNTEPEFISVNSKVDLFITKQTLMPGRSYRFSVSFCAGDLCFPKVESKRITVIPNKPVAHSLSAEYVPQNDGLGKVIVEFIGFQDLNIMDERESRDVISYYEYIIKDANGGVYHQWLPAENITKVNITSCFVVDLDSKIDFSRMKTFTLRGYDKVGDWQTISAEIKSYSSYNENLAFHGKKVVDALGNQCINEDRTIQNGFGKEIEMPDDGKWTNEDVDNTPYRNILSATWDTLKHHNYTYSVIIVKNVDALTYYRNQEGGLNVTDPCSHPDTVKCGQTENEYVNILFEPNEWLENGKRYVICVHAPRTVIDSGNQSVVMEEENVCSDGVTVDLDPPVPGRAWIGSTTNETCNFQTSTSEISLSWDSFTDVEVYGFSTYITGIKTYVVAVGSVEGGNDIINYTDVGLVNHVTFSNLLLQNGQTIYGSVKGIDLTLRSTTVYAAGVTMDYTPPGLTSNSITVVLHHTTNISHITVCWKNKFYDKESGIEKYSWGIGSKPKLDDIAHYQDTNEECQLYVDTANLYEGHAYFVNVKAFNKAGLVTMASSPPYYYSKSPPVAGYVYDGFKGKARDYQRDVDFQADGSKIGAFWDFHDPYLPINYYKRTIGTTPGSDDILEEDGWLANSITMKNTHLKMGKRYYTTVKACNTANLCTTVTSDGVIMDNTPPIPGTVYDGTGDRDIDYQAFRNSLSVSWKNFSDPQSGLDRFMVRAGRSIDGNDILNASNVYVQLGTSSAIIVINNNLPTGTRIFVTVQAYNRAGLFSEISTDGFIVDETPPAIIQKPTLYTKLGSIRQNSIIYRSCFRVIWDVEDPESAIGAQYISLSSHIGVEITTTSIKVRQLNGTVRSYTFTDLDLYDGNEYFVKLIVCNGAKLCVGAASDGITVDSSPPIMGTFAINTDQSTSWERHVPGWMLWSRHKLWLSWLGFSDAHSGIDYYVVSVGSSYMRNDLHNDSMPQFVCHNNSGIQRHEGPVQTLELETAELSDFQSIYISVFAVNMVGLKSEILHHKFNLINGGFMEIVRRCSPETCFGHCACSPRLTNCRTVRTPCVDVTKDNTTAFIHVTDVTDLRDNTNDVNFTVSKEVLAARWTVVENQGSPPLWYEWSVGRTALEEPSGVIDDFAQVVWHHCGQMNSAIYSLPRGRILPENVTFSFFVRAWYDSKKYSLFKSDGVKVVSKTVFETELRNGNVLEQLP